ncbi:hypothetical protein CMI37_13425 [Candidatus Pacearchaeota archaeon]|nr:hypothetical protein [Candidatus Pacearchaeota archaeon]|tara:strand:+ start:998 stop:1645 length:648 start_codon:yes stop_codon:yes gene_type:complete
MKSSFNQISFETHDSQYEESAALEREREALVRKELANYIELYKSDHPQGKDLDKFNWVKCAVDIGSGTGWFSSYLVRKRGYEKVYAIEPSTAAVEISKKLHPNIDGIEWIDGFAEEEILRLNLTEPTFFNFMCVLSHMPDDLVISICDAIYKISPVGSFVSFSENWGNASANVGGCWHVRTPQWWASRFMDWHFEFSTTFSHSSGVYKGFTAFKF